MFAETIIRFSAGTASTPIRDRPPIQSQRGIQVEARPRRDGGGIRCATGPAGVRQSDDRAHSVQRYLVNKGVEKNRLKAKGFGETRPVDRRHNEAAWSKNRRVEFVILKRAE